MWSRNSRGEGGEGEKGSRGDGDGRASLSARVRRGLIGSPLVLKKGCFNKGRDVKSKRHKKCQNP